MMRTNIYTMQDWERDNTLSPKIGQEISDEVYWELFTCMPPTFSNFRLFQCGEAYDHDTQYNAPLYMTFTRNDNLKWVYCGLCLYGKTENREKHGAGYLYYKKGKYI